jgi:proline iminopeptidase
MPPTPSDTPHPDGQYIPLADTRLFVVERGSGFPVLVLHGGPGLDHHMFGDYLDPLTDRYRLILVDQRSQGKSDMTPESTWTLEQLARDVTALADALKLDRYAVLGHSYGAMVALQNAVDFPGRAAASIISSGVPSAAFMHDVERNLAEFEPVEMREQVKNAWAREALAQTQEDVAALLRDQMPFHFANPRDPRLLEYERRSGGAVYSPAVLRHAATSEYGGIDVVDRLGEVTHPVLVLSGRHDRTTTVKAGQSIAHGIPDAERVIFEESGHMTFVEENARYLAVVRAFLDRHAV